jgi:hypothetical protein
MFKETALISYVQYDEVNYKYTSKIDIKITEHLVFPCSSLAVYRSKGLQD